MVYLSFAIVLLLVQQSSAVDSYQHGATFSMEIDAEGAEASDIFATPKAVLMRKAPGASKVVEGPLASQSIPEPKNFVINCPGDTKRLARFRKHMDRAGLTFEVFPCVQLTRASLKQAILDGFLGRQAERGDLREAGVLSIAMSHIKLLDLIRQRNIPAANIFEDDEIVYDSYLKDRRMVLDHLPHGAEFVNLNPRQPEGEVVEGAGGKLLRMTVGISKWSSGWTSNYFVSAAGSHQLFRMMTCFDLGPSGDLQIDAHIVEMISSGCAVCHLNAYTYATNVLSMHCENYSEKETKNKQGLGASLVEHHDPNKNVDPRCIADPVEGKWR